MPETMARRGRGRLIFFALLAVLGLSYFFYPGPGAGAAGTGLSAFQRAPGTDVHLSSALPLKTGDGKKPRIAIVTFVTHELSFLYMSLKNKNAYARKHGYDLTVEYEAHEPRGTMWHKFVMIENAMKKGNADWIWWIDFDTLITNGTIELADIVIESLANSTEPEKIDFFFTADCFELNAGSMLVRSTPRALAFLNKVRAYGDTHHDLSEQDCIRDVVAASSEEEKKQTIWIPQYKMNAFPEEIRCWDKYDKGFERGVFVVHFAGAWAHVKEEDPAGFLMRKYEGEIVGFEDEGQE